MPDSEIKPRARRKRRRLWKFGALLLIGIGAGGLFPNQTLNPVVRRLAPMAASWAGWELQLAGLSGAPWSEWRLEGLQLQPKDLDQPLRAVRLQEVRLRVASDFWFSPELENVKDVWARGGHVDWIVPESSGDSESTGKASQLDPSAWPRLDLADCGVRVERTGVDSFEVEGLRLGLKNAARPGAPRTLGIKLKSAKHRVPGQPEQEYGFDGLMEWFGSRLNVQECNLSRVQGGQVELKAELDLANAARPTGTFELLCANWPLADVGGLTARAEGELRSDGLSLNSLDARSGRSTTLRLQKLSLPWPADGEPWSEALLPALEGELVAGGSDLELWLERFGGSQADREWPLGSYLLEASVSDGLVQIQQARVTLESPDWPAPVLVTAKGDLALDPARSAETQVAGLLSVGKGTWARDPGTRLEWPSITGAFAFEGAWPAGTGHLELHPSDWILTSPDQPEVAMNWSGRCDLEAGQLHLRSLLGRFGTVGQRGELPGEVKLRGMLPKLEELTADAHRAPFDLQADVTLRRLAPLRALLPDLRRIDGSATGQLALGGTLSEPKLRGSLEAQAESVRFTWGETLRQVTAHVDWQDSSKGTFGLLGEYGGAPLDIVGNLSMEAGKTAWDATLQTKDFPLLRTPDARIRADGNLRASGVGPTFDVNGDVYLTHGRLHRDFDLAGSLLAAVDGLKGSSSPKAPPTEDSELLEFDFPENCNLRVGLHTNKPVELISDLGRSSLEIEGVLIGRSGRLHPEGTVVLNGGKISLPGSSLTWKQGVVLLPKGGGPPTIEAQGTTRLASHDVMLRIHGPLRDPLLDLSSTPSRPDYDLLILLLTGELPQGRDWSRTTESLSIYLAKDVLKRWLGSDGGDGEGLFDRFEFTTGREVSESGLGTLEAMFRLNGDASGQGKALWITAERDRHEDVNFGLRFVLRPR